jgi:transcriptional regulator with XRE-family HTH domain
LDRFYLESGVSKGHLSEILRGVSSPSVATLVKVAEALGVEVKDFFVFPDENQRHRVIALLESCSKETVDAVLELLSQQSQHATRKK